MNQLIIELVDFYDSVRSNHSPLAELLRECREGEDGSVITSMDLQLLLAAVGTAKAWGALGTWDMSFVKDCSMRYVWVSDQFSEALGLRLDDIQGKSDQELYDSVTEADEVKTSEAVMQGAKAHFPRTRMVDGALRIFHDSLWRIPEKGLSEAGWIVGVSRVVEQKGSGIEQEYYSTAMLEALEKAKKVAKFDSRVILTGETGSGKGHLAEIIHRHSRRANMPLLTLNCAAIPKDLAESMLFGHEKGAFTGAVKTKRGVLELANSGTLMLDEIGKMPLEIQGKLLVFLDGKGFSRVGSEETLEPDVRLLAASNRDLEELVTEGLFLEDLYYRLNVVQIKVPPLRERFEDLPILLPKLLDNVCKRIGLSERPRITSSHIAELKRYTLSGNVRELENVLERALVLGDGKKLDLRKALNDSTQNTEATHASGWQTVVRYPKHGRSLDDVLGQVSRELVEETLRRKDGNKSEVARSLRIGRDRLRKILRQANESGSR